MLSSRTILLAALIGTTIGSNSDSLAQANAGSDLGTFSGRFNLRFESVDQNNAVDDAEALTLSSKLAYTSGTFSGFSATVEVENVMIIGGIDNFSVGPSNFKPGRYSVIADPETTELDQGFLQYRNAGFTAKVGRQVITYDNHRFVGHVGWRQDRQTFDALSLNFKPNDSWDINYNYLDKRRRIFAEDADIDSDDHLLHVDYLSSIGTLTGYAYLLEVENNSKNSLDTIGLKVSGSRELAGVGASYLIEYARQESNTAAARFDADYLLLEGGMNFDLATIRVGYEILGSDNGSYGFTTPLSTLHAHNGWADVFLATPSQGLTDTYLNLSGSAWGGNWSLIYHDFDTEDAFPLIDDLGRELDLQFLYPVSDNFSLGIKYASYSHAGSGNSKVDTDKFWFWLTVSF